MVKDRCLLSRSAAVDATLQVPVPDGTVRTWKAADLAGRKELATAFGTLALSE